MRNRFWLLLLPLLVVGITTSAWSLDASQFGYPAEKCDPSKGHCVSTIVFTNTPVPPAPVRLEIYRLSMNEDGTPDTNTLRQLTRDEVSLHGLVVANAFAKFSPGGKRIVFDSNRNRLPTEPANTSDLFLMKADGQDQRLLTRGSSATWSPNGKYIAFHASASGTGLPIRPDPGAPYPDSDIFVMRVLDDDEIEGPINITNSPLDVEEDPDWSPDGKKIVFTRHPDTEHPTE